MPGFLDILLSHKLVYLTKILETSRKEDEMTESALERHLTENSSYVLKLVTESIFDWMPFSKPTLNFYHKLNT